MNKYEKEILKELQHKKYCLEEEIACFEREIANFQESVSQRRHDLVDINMTIGRYEHPAND